jgi:predicted Zn-dependent protease
MAAVIARLAMLLAAAAAIVVSAVWLNDAHSQSAATDALNAGDFERAARLYEDGRALAPDSAAKASQAFALLKAGRADQAAALLEEVVRREPRNARAWSALAFAERDRDPARAAEAMARVRELSPPVGPTSR